MVACVEEDLDENTRLVVVKVMLRSMSFIVTPKAVSNTSKSCTCEDPSPVRIAACTAAPETTVRIKTHCGDSRTECRKVEFHHYLIELLQQEIDASDTRMMQSLRK